MADISLLQKSQNLPLNFHFNFARWTYCYRSNLCRAVPKVVSPIFLIIVIKDFRLNTSYCSVLLKMVFSHGFGFTWFLNFRSTSFKYNYNTNCSTNILFVGDFKTARLTTHHNFQSNVLLNQMLEDVACIICEKMCAMFTIKHRNSSVRQQQEKTLRITKCVYFCLQQFDSTTVVKDLHPKKRWGLGGCTSST